MYNEPVKFSVTGTYGSGPENEDDVYTIEEFKALCDNNMFIDYDGYGYPVKDSMADSSIIIIPSDLRNIPKDATHIVWFNR
jgi:hypothetical protein